jgi:alpha-1,2-mannosyltransferase
MDDDASCKAPSGEAAYWSPFGLSPTSVAFIVAPAIAFIPMFVLFGIPAIWRAWGAMLGTYLRHKTDGRRAQLLEVMAHDEEKYIAKGEEHEDSGEKGKKDIWKKIEASIVEKLPKGDKADKEWSGIVGFFHPFWYALLQWNMRMSHVTDRKQQCWRRWRAGPLGCHPSYPEALAQCQDCRLYWGP